MYCRTTFLKWSTVCYNLPLFENSSRLQPDYNVLSRIIADIDRKVLGVWVLKDAEPIGSFVRPKNPVPNSDRLKIIFIQASVMVGMPKIHEDLYGRFNAIIVKHENLDAVLLPIGKNMVVAVGCKAPFSAEKFVESAMQIIDNFDRTVR